ncbi:MAG: hypothetical protein LBE85_03785 [Candidatus Accumulibacter sp.]|jgi:uncharacterized protein|nr:hypothetical protein [Accumulibacter sp.]
MKYLLLIGLALIVLWFFRKLNRRRSGTGRASAGRRPERMVQCARCGIHLPESESIRDGAVHYCCHEHRLDRHDP